MTDENNPLPAEIDNETTIFSYGSLLEHAQLRALLTARGQFEILETVNLEEAARLAQANPKDIVVLKNVRLENVRASIVTERMLRRWYQSAGGNIETLIAEGVTTPEIPPAVFLYARTAEIGEKGRALNGGLICNLTETEIAKLDRYEFAPVLQRVRAPRLKIGRRTFSPKHIAFYAGTENSRDITPEEKTERAALLNRNRKRGELSPQARWRRDVRRK